MADEKEAKSKIDKDISEIMPLKDFVLHCPPEIATPLFIFKGVKVTVGKRFLEGLKKEGVI